MSDPTDLGALCDEHVASEFEHKDLDRTMATMTEAPYVWHVPVMTGPAGREEVRSFYSSQFVVMGFEDGKVAYERIYWDQASVLAQVGLLDPSSLPVVGVEQAERLLELSGTEESAPS